MPITRLKLVLAIGLLAASRASLACSWQDPLSCVQDLKQAVTSPAPSRAAPPAKTQTASLPQAPIQATLQQDAECPLFDLLSSCKREQERKQQQARDEAVYQDQLKGAVARRTGRIQGSWVAGSAEAACSEAKFDLRSDNGLRCIRDVQQKYDEYRSRLQAGNAKIGSCREWAIAKGSRWEAAQSDLQIEREQSVTPVMFKGEVESGKNGTLTIKHFSDNACVNISAETFVLNHKNLKVGQELQGYGLQTGRQMIAMVDGQRTAIPVIEAACLE